MNTSPITRPARSASATKDTVLVAIFAAMIAAMGLVPPITLGFIPVPITLQTMGVMLAGAMLGPVRGMLSALTIVVLVAAGLPLLSGGRGGLGVFAGPTGGYLLGWVLGALVTGLLYKYWALRHRSSVGRFLSGFLSAIIGGVLLVYCVGIPWTTMVTGIPMGTSAIGSLGFLPGDLLKAAITTLVAMTVHRSYSGLMK
ncbi:biotin transporter BioY [Glutamicibacter uratoxydans]|uniref:biotin transporter BioY n=1 Tax=Glutamicibacter uratoxydans TaxID=43667 RepID=UPI003D6FDD54